MIPALIVPVLVRPELLDRMLVSIDYPIEHLVVINNGGQSITPECKWVEQISVINMPANLGVAGSWNLGIKATPFYRWWLIANFDVVWPPESLAKFAEESAADTITLAHAAPPWCAFTIGEHIVKTVGLFDERLHPAYFEDNDMERRTEAAGYSINHSDIPVHHTNSSTLQAGYAVLNSRTFADNAEFYGRKTVNHDMTWGWDLTRRRELSWD